MQAQRRGEPFLATSASKVNRPLKRAAPASRWPTGFIGGALQTGAAHSADRSSRVLQRAGHQPALQSTIRFSRLHHQPDQITTIQSLQVRAQVRAAQNLTTMLLLVKVSQGDGNAVLAEVALLTPSGGALRFLRSDRTVAHCGLNLH